jgi:hypothetical protein
VEHLGNPFEYLAFNETHLAVLAHGMTAAEALQRAEHIAADTTIHVLHAGQPGWKIWYFRKFLAEAGSEIISREVDGTSAWTVHTPRTLHAQPSTGTAARPLSAVNATVTDVQNIGVVVPFPAARGPTFSSEASPSYSSGA